MYRCLAYFVIFCFQFFLANAIRQSMFSREKVQLICNLRGPMISALVGCTLLHSTPAHATGLSSLSGIARASESVDYILANLDREDVEVTKLFDEIDIIIKRFYLRDRLQLAIAETPAQYRYDKNNREIFFWEQHNALFQQHPACSSSPFFLSFLSISPLHLSLLLRLSFSISARYVEAVQSLGLQV